MRQRPTTRAHAARARGRPKKPLTASAAAKKGDLNALRTAVAGPRRVDPTTLLSTAVAWATESKGERYAEVAAFLIGVGANPAGRGGLGMPMVSLAARSGVARLVLLLREAGADVSFYSSAAVGDIDAVREALATSPDAANTPDENGMTAIQYCANSALGRADSATEARLAKVAGLLLDHGANANASPEPLSVAAGHSGNMPLVQLLLARAPNPPYPGPLSEALRTMRRQGDRYSRICDVLVEHGPYDLDSMLLGQARHEDVQATRWLLAHGADPSLRLEDGRTTLHLSADRNSGTRVIELLLAYGADLDARDDLGHTPLYYARQSEKEKIVAFLRSRSAAE